MMSYELALKLWDARFPFDPTKVTPHILTGAGNPKCIVPPNLSELIEACGSGMFELARVVDRHQWLCKGGEKYTAVIGPTPEEAVANLWLALHTVDNDSTKGKEV